MRQNRRSLSVSVFTAASTRGSTTQSGECVGEARVRSTQSLERSRSSTLATAWPNRFFNGHSFGICEDRSTSPHARPKISKPQNLISPPHPSSYHLIIFTHSSLTPQHFLITLSSDYQVFILILILFFHYLFSIFSNLFYHPHLSLFILPIFASFLLPFILFTLL